MNNDPEMLVGLSVGELEVLSDSLLAPSAQVRLDELLARNAQHQLGASDVAELDRLLSPILYPPSSLPFPGSARKRLQPNKNPVSNRFESLTLAPSLH